jgi:hypothetical protein
MRRVFFGVCWFLFFWLGVGAAFAGVMGAIAAKQMGATNFSEGLAVGQEVGEDLARRSGPYFLFGGLLILFVGTVTGALPGMRRRSERSDSAQQAMAADRADERRATAERRR